MHQFTESPLPVLGCTQLAGHGEENAAANHLISLLWRGEYGSSFPPGEERMEWKMKMSHDKNNLN